jgi:hypothetical protein
MQALSCNNSKACQYTTPEHSFAQCHSHWPEGTLQTYCFCARTTPFWKRKTTACLIKEEPHSQNQEKHSVHLLNCSATSPCIAASEGTETTSGSGIHSFCAPCLKRASTSRPRPKGTAISVTCISKLKFSYHSTHPVNHFGPLRYIWYQSRGSRFESSGPQKHRFCARFTLRRITSEWTPF